MISIASIIAAGMMLVSRDAIGAAQNRLGLARASWRANGCAAAVMAATDELLRHGSRQDSVWAALDELISVREAEADCQVTFRPVGMAVDVNAANETQLCALFRGAGIQAAAADSLSDQLLDWMDTDETPRAHGAEREWYAQERRFAPRNGAIADQRELYRIGSVGSVPALDELLTTEHGRILIGRAPLAVLGSLPGVSEEALVRIAVRRARSSGQFTWPQIAEELSSATRVEMMRELLELERRTTLSPDAWMVYVTASDGQPVVTATIELRIMRWNAGAKVVRRRSWP